MVFALICGTMSCSEKNADAPFYNKVHSQTWLDPNFVNTELFHGFQTNTQTMERCMKCHEIYSDGNQYVPGCLKCHFDPYGSRVPAGADWTHGRDGHEDFQENRTVCNKCHDVGRRFNAGPGICHNCHGFGEEHVLGQPWLDQDSPQFHGDQPQEDCAICHNLSTNCNECHFGPTGAKSPPGSGWPHGREDNHNDQKAYSAVCNRCHALTQSYRNEPDDPECHVCHNE